MLDFFTFDTLITPYIISYVYFLGAVAVPILIFIYLQKSTMHIGHTKSKTFIFILFVMLEIAWRIFCEFFMVYFKIFLTLQS